MIAPRAPQLSGPQLPALELRLKQLDVDRAEVFQAIKDLKGAANRASEPTQVTEPSRLGRPLGAVLIRTFTTEIRTGHYKLGQPPVGEGFYPAFNVGQCSKQMRTRRFLWIHEGKEPDHPNHHCGHPS